MMLCWTGRGRKFSSSENARKIILWNFPTVPVSVLSVSSAILMEIRGILKAFIGICGVKVVEEKNVEEKVGNSWGLKTSKCMVLIGKI